MSLPVTQFCQLSFEDAVLCITLNRPEVLNALHCDAHHELSAVFNWYRDTPEARVAIITGGIGRSFCVGSDLKAMAQSGTYPYPHGGFAGITKRFDLYKPVIAAVNGLCLGGGVEILAATDIAIAADTASFGLPEPLVGHAAIGGGALQRLARQIPLKEAMKLALTGQRIDAQEARRIGMINEIVPLNDVLPRAKTIAQQIIACAPLSIEATKQVLIDNTNYASLEDAMFANYPAAERMLASEDSIEGPRAFAEKRKPVWRGR